MNRLHLSVSGMSCIGCESRIAGALGRLDGVRHVTADHRAATVVVDYDATDVQESAIRQRLEDAGYQIDEVKSR